MIKYTFQAKSVKFFGDYSPFHISSGKIIEQDDTKITEFFRLIDAQNRDFPCIPGSTLRGYFRSIIESQGLTKKGWNDAWEYIWFSNVALESAIRNIHRVFYHPPMQKRGVEGYAEFLTIPNNSPTKVEVYCCTSSASSFFEEILGKFNAFFLERVMMDHEIAKKAKLTEAGEYTNIERAKHDQSYYLKLGRFCGRQWKITRAKPVPRHITTIRNASNNIPVGFLELTFIDKKEASNFEFS
jgi:hypothetical protein